MSDLPLDIISTLIVRAARNLRDVICFARVCREWRDAAYDDFVWEKMWDQYFSNYEPITSYLSLASGYRNIFRLVYTSWQYIARPGWRVISTGDNLSIVHLVGGRPRCILYLSEKYRDTGSVLIADSGVKKTLFLVSTESVQQVDEVDWPPACFDARQETMASDVIRRNGFRVFFNTQKSYLSPTDTIEIHHDQSSLSLHINISLNTYWINRLDTGKQIACFSHNSLDLVNPPVEEVSCMDSLLYVLRVKKRYQRYIPLELN